MKKYQDSALNFEKSVVFGYEEIVRGLFETSQNNGFVKYD